MLSRCSEAGLNTLTATAQQREKVLMEDKAQDQQDQRATQADVNPAKTKSAASTAAGFVAAIFDVGAFSTGRPTHKFLSSKLGEMVTPQITGIVCAGNEKASG